MNPRGPSHGPIFGLRIVHGSCTPLHTPDGLLAYMVQGLTALDTAPKEET
jgi:hypothetical protein